jgi:hypothetical protein
MNVAARDDLPAGGGSVAYASLPIAPPLCEL